MLTVPAGFGDTAAYGMINHRMSDWKAPANSQTPAIRYPMAKRRQRKKNRMAKLLVYSIVLGILGVFVWHKYIAADTHDTTDAATVANGTDAQTPAPTAADLLSAAQTPSAASTSPNATSAPTTGIAGAVASALNGSHGTYAVAIKNLKTGETFYQNEHHVFNSGSLYKLWVMAVAEQQIQNGSLDPNQVLSNDVETLNKEHGISDDDAELTSGTITMPATLALNQMITISHNYAAMLLTDRVGVQSITSFLKTAGLSESDIDNNGNMPTTTAADVEKFYEALYNGHYGNPDTTNAMITLLKGQTLNEKLPEYLPSGTVVAHKTGEIDDFSHDAGIVYSPNGDYIIAVLSESDDPQSANERIANISRNVYNYFTNTTPEGG